MTGAISNSLRIKNPRLPYPYVSFPVKETNSIDSLLSEKEYSHGKLFVFASGKGGVGKTSLSVNIALSACQLGYPITLIDGDLGKANAHVLLGIHPKKTISSLFKEEISMKQIMIETHHGLKFIPGAGGRFDLANMDGLDSGRFANAINSFRRDVPFLILDAPAGYGKMIFQWVDVTDELIVITTPVKTALLDAYGLIKIATEQYHLNNISILVNMVDSNDHGKKTFEHLNQCVLRFLNRSLTYLGAVRKDSRMDKALARGDPLVCQKEKSNAKSNLIEITKKLFGKEYTKNGDLKF